MVNQSLRSRLMFMAILPALMAALVVGGYSLVNRLVDVRDTNAQRQQLVTDSFAARLESTAATDTARQQRLLRQLPATQSRSWGCTSCSQSSGSL